MFYSVHFWTNWETAYLELEGVVPLSRMLSFVQGQVLAAGCYFVAFCILIPTVYAIWGQGAAFVVWAVIGSVFELVQFIMVKIKYGTLSALLRSPKEMLLLSAAAVLIIALGVVTYYLYD